MRDTIVAKKCWLWKPNFYQAERENCCKHLISFSLFILSTFVCLKKKIIKNANIFARYGIVLQRFIFNSFFWIIFINSFLNTVCRRNECSTIKLLNFRVN